jgi:hypothetical protein
MPLSRYLSFMCLASILCWAAWYFVVAYIHPPEAGLLGLGLFYATLTLAVAGTFALVGFGIRTLFLKQEPEFEKVVISYRQGIFFALLIDGFLLLQSMRLLAWYNVVFLLFAVTLAELFIISKKEV